MAVCRRYHFFEVNDQSWFPQFLREKVQDDLTLLWTFRVPILQRTSPAQLVASTIATVLGRDTSAYTYVDFCSGAGGPTPFIEKYLNDELKQRAEDDDKPNAPVQFVLTDIHPHVEAWEMAAKKSDNLGFIKDPVDATNAPKDLLGDLHTDHGQQKLLRLFNLAFHHFDDDMAIRILENTLETSDGFGIFELQNRTAPNFITITLMWPLLLLITPFFFFNSPIHLIFSYLCPIVPFVVVFDGYISSLRTRTPEEVKKLLEVAADRLAKRTRAERGSVAGKAHEEITGGAALLKKWTFKSGSEMHTPPIGTMSWIMCTKQ